MADQVCKVCGLIIRRPIDHRNCPGSMNERLLTTRKPKVSLTDITQEIEIPIINEQPKFHWTWKF